MPSKLSVRGIKRLEVTMRDVLDGLDDAASFMNYQSSPDSVEILSIEPPGRLISQKAKIPPSKLTVDNVNRHSIVDYLIKRELKRSA